MILQTIIQVIFYFLMIPFTILMAIVTSMFIYWRYLHRIMLLYLPTPNKPHVMGPNFDDNHEEFPEEKDQKQCCFLAERKFQQQQQQQEQEERVKLSAAKTATSIKNRIVMTKEIDSLMKKIVDNLLEYYLLVWYRPLIVYDQPKYQSKSTESLEHFREALRDNLWKLFSCFIDRLYNVNHVTFISQDLIYRLLKHFQNLKTTSSEPPPRSSSSLLVNDSVGGRVDEKHNIPNNTTKTNGDNPTSDDDDHDQTATNNKSIGHRKNQPSSSSIQTNFSSTSSNCSGVSSACQPNQSSLGDADDDDQEDVDVDDKQSIGSMQRPPVASKNAANDDPTNHNDNNKCFFYPLASHLAGDDGEKSLIHSLARFLLDTLINDSSGYDQDPKRSTTKSDGQKLSLIRGSQTLRTFLDDLLAKILYEAIRTITQPTLINCQIIKVLESNFLLKDFIMKQHGDGDGAVSGEFDGDDDDDDSDDDEDADADHDHSSQIMSKKSVFILNEMKQCLVDNNFDHLYELIDKCNNVKLLKHIRLKLIAEILDAAVVSHLDRTIVGTTVLFQQNDDHHWLDNQSRRSSNSSSGVGDYNPRQRHFNFNAKMDLKFKKFRKEKNLKRLVNRLKFAKTICEQKIQFRRRTLASALPDPNHVMMDPSHGSKVLESGFDDYDISFKQDLVKSVSLDDSIFAHAHSAAAFPGGGSGSLADQLLLDDDNQDSAQPRPKHKKIFKFQQIVANEFSRDYFRKFLQQSLLQNDSNVNKRSSLMKFRKDVLLVDCTIYMFEFWLHLQLIFQTLLDWLQASNIPGSKSASKPRHHSLLESFQDAYNLLLIMVADQRFFYTFSQQFLSIPSDLMRSLERFLLGDLELNAMDLSKISFQLNNTEECFLFQQNTTIKAETTDVLQKIDWRKHFAVFERLEKILFNCLNDEFYPQFLISKEYDEILLKYFKHGQSLRSQPPASTKPETSTSPRGKPTVLLMDLRKKLPIEDWYDYWTNHATNHNRKRSYLFQLDHRLRVKPVNKILLVNGQPQKSGLNSIGDSNNKKFIDLHKNRKMLLNTIEFPFCYLSFMQVVHVNRFRLKWTIKQIVEEFVQKRAEPEDMSMNRLLEDLLSNLGKDLARLGDQIDQIKRILLRTFCWLNADFSTVINNCRFNGNYEQLLLSSTANTAESKILSFVENLFLKPSSTSSSAADRNHNNDTNPFSSSSSSSSSSSDNLKFKVNVTALLSKFQYVNHQQQQQQQHRKLPTLPDPVRNELMSNWSYQWNVDVTLQQLQTFHHRILIPFIRIIIFLARFQIKNYVTTVMDVLLDCSRDMGVAGRPRNSPKNVLKQRPQDNNNNDIKILEKFVNKTNQILVEIRQQKRSMLNELKRNRFYYFGQDHNTATSSAKQLPVTSVINLDQIQNQNQTSGGGQATISFRNLLQKEQQQQQSLELVDTDVQEVTETCSLLTPPKNHAQSTRTTAATMMMNNSNEQNRLLKQMETSLNSYFQQIIAQDSIVKSVGFLHLIRYDDDQQQPETMVSGHQQQQWECLRCQLYEWMFVLNEDHGLNHYVQMFLFRMLFDDHYHNRSKTNIDDHGHEDQDDVDDDHHYWERLMNQMLDPNSIGNGNGKGENGSGQQTTMAANTKRNPTDPATVRLNSKLFFMQTRSLLMDRTALDCFDFTLDSLKCFTVAARTFCPECDRIMVDSRRRMIIQSSFPANNSQSTTSSSSGSGSLAKFRLFNLALDLDDQDHHQQSTVSSTSNLMDLISTVGNSIGFGGGGGNAQKHSTTTTTSSSSSIFNLGHLFSSNKHQPPLPPPATSTAAGGSSSTNSSSNNIPDLLLNGGNLDEPSLFSLFNDENQLIEPLFLLLIEIFELEGGTVTKTLRRTLMFGMRLFFGQTKMMSRPYKQFMQTLFTEKNVFRWMSKVNAHLEELLKCQQQQQQLAASSPATTAASRQHSRDADHPTSSSSRTEPEVDLRVPDVDDNEDEYLKYLNDMLGSLETGKDHHQASSNDGDGGGGGVRIVQATAEADCQPSTSAQDGVVDERKYLVEDDDNDDDYDDGGDPPILDEEQQRQLIRDRKLQIIAKQMLFVSIPTFLSHLFGQQNIDKGVNKCFDMLQYQKLNKHLVYEFIEAFLLEYFPEFRKLSTAATTTITTDGPMAEQQEQGPEELD